MNLRKIHAAWGLLVGPSYHGILFRSIFIYKIASRILLDRWELNVYNYENS